MTQNTPVLHAADMNVHACGTDLAVILQVTGMFKGQFFGLDLTVILPVPGRSNGEVFRPERPFVSDTHPFFRTNQADTVGIHAS